MLATCMYQSQIVITVQHMECILLKSVFLRNYLKSVKEDVLESVWGFQSLQNNIWGGEQIF
jgi:hypothetical protein